MNIAVVSPVAVRALQLPNETKQIKLGTHGSMRYPHVDAIHQKVRTRVDRCIAEDQDKTSCTSVNSVSSCQMLRIPRRSDNVFASTLALHNCLASREAIIVGFLCFADLRQPRSGAYRICSAPRNILVEMQGTPECSLEDLQNQLGMVQKISRREHRGDADAEKYIQDPM